MRTGEHRKDFPSLHTQTTARHVRARVRSSPIRSCGYTPSRESPCELDACEIEPHESIPPRMVERDEDEYEFELDSWARYVGG
eukprot:6189264-Pleurochrysis_carterae.AAC.1